MYRILIANLAEFKAQIMQHIHNIAPEILQSVKEHAVYHFQLEMDNVGQHMEAYPTMYD